MARPHMRKMMIGATVAGVLSLVAPGVASAHSGNDTQRGGDTQHSSDTKPATDTRHATTDENSNDNQSAKDQTKGNASATQRCLAQVDRRVSDLDALLTKVAASTTLTPAHRSALTTMLTDAKTGLVTLRATIVADTDPSTLRADCQKVVTDFRIYALRLPQVHLVMAADAAQNKQAKFTALEAQLQAAITAAGTNPHVADAQALLADLQTKVAAGLAASSGVGDAVLVLTPADWNANHQVLKPFLAKIRETSKDFHAASKDAHKILELLGSGED